MDLEELVLELTAAIHKEVKPHLGKLASRRIMGAAVGGDATFAIDEHAEQATYEFLERAGNVAYYSEDKGLVEFGSPEYVLIVDPIDGTRPAAAGLESCCVSVAATRYAERPTMGDVCCAAIQELKNDALFFASESRLAIETNGRAVEPVLTDTTDLSKIFWCVGFRGRPARILVEVLGDLIDKSSVDGAVFDIGSATFSMTRLITGQLDAYVDIGKRIIEEVPWTADEFARVGKGSILNNNPYDVAASAYIVKRARCLVTDDRGRSVGDREVLGSGPPFQMPMVASTNEVLHGKLLEAIEAGMATLKAVGEAERSRLVGGA